jgi:hypothetical protein
MFRLKIRIFLTGGMQRLLHDIAKDTLTNQSDIDLVGDCCEGDELHPKLAARGIDLVIVGAQLPADVSSVNSILFASPQVKLLAIETNGRTSTIYRLHPHQLSLGELSPQELLAVIRTEVASQ